MADKKQKTVHLNTEQERALEVLALITGKSCSDLLDEALGDLGEHKYLELLKESGLSIEKILTKHVRRSRKKVQ